MILYRLAFVGMWAMYACIIITMAGCAAVQTETAAPLTAGERVAVAMRKIIAAEGHAPPAVLVEYSRALFDAGDWQGCATAADNALDRTNLDPTVLNLKAACEAESGDLPLARHDFQAAIDLGDKAAVVNLAKLPVLDANGNSTHATVHPVSIKRMGGHPKRPVSPPAAAKPIKWLDRIL